MKPTSILIAGIVALTAAGVAQADINISAKPTRNITCSRGVCTATAAQAVLNAGDLANMLTAGDVKVIADSLSSNIRLLVPFSWSNGNRLSLISYASLVFAQPLTVSGHGALTMTNNSGGAGGDIQFLRRRHTLSFGIWVAA